MKRYISPTCEVVNIKRPDIVTSSDFSVFSNVDLFYAGGGTGSARVSGRGFYDWDAGY